MSHFNGLTQTPTSMNRLHNLDPQDIEWDNSDTLETALETAPETLAFFNCAYPSASDRKHGNSPTILTHSFLHYTRMPNSE